MSISYMCIHVALGNLQVLLGLRLTKFDVTLEISLPTAPATRKKRRMFDELAADEVIANPVDSYRVSAYLPIIDRLCTEISSRFNERSSVLYTKNCR